MVRKEVYIVYVLVCINHLGMMNIFVLRDDEVLPFWVCFRPLNEQTSQPTPNSGKVSKIEITQHSLQHNRPHKSNNNASSSLEQTSNEDLKPHTSKFLGTRKQTSSKSRREVHCCLNYCDILFLLIPHPSLLIS